MFVAEFRRWRDGHMFSGLPSPTDKLFLKRYITYGLFALGAERFDAEITARLCVENKYDGMIYCPPGWACRINDTQDPSRLPTFPFHSSPKEWFLSLREYAEPITMHPPIHAEIPLKYGQKPGSNRALYSTFPVPVYRSNPPILNDTWLKDCLSYL